MPVDPHALGQRIVTLRRARGLSQRRLADALQDDRFADNPLVTGEPRVRFYAGAPLTLKNGTHAGTLCVIDHRARNLDESQLQLLRDLAKLVEREFQTSPAAVRE